MLGQFYCNLQQANKTCNIKFYTVHYKSINSVSNFIHLRLIDYLNFLRLLHITITVTID